MKTSFRLIGCLSLSLVTGVSLAEPGSAAPSTSAAAAASAKAVLPWPARLPVSSGLKPETERLAGPGWQPKGTIEPVGERLTSIHLTSSRSVSVKTGQQADWELWKSRAASLPKGVEPQFERPGGFVFVPAISDDPAPATTSLMFRFVSARDVPSPKAGEKTVAIERTWFTLYDPIAPKAEPGEPPADAPAPRGLVVFLPGMFGTPGDQIVGLTRRLRQEGYCVLRMMSQPSRFTENASYVLPADGDFGDSIPQIAADLCDRAAEAAYAVEAAVLYAKQERPLLRNVPRVAIGMSGGAMLLPIVMSREPGAYTGAVSIAGGVDYLKILTTSNYANWIDAVRVKWMGQAKGADGSVAVSETATAKRVDELSAAYRKLAPLDSANLAASLKSVPWLLLHGSVDKAVPAGTGEELWELLGKPERIVIKGGHEWVFMTLASKYGAIADWLNKRVPSTPQPAGTRP